MTDLRKALSVNLTPKQKAWNEHKQAVRQEQAQARALRTATDKGRVRGREERRALRFSRTPATEMPANIAHYTQRKGALSRRLARLNRRVEVGEPIKRYRRGRGTYLTYQAGA